jgi:hypothetical protein
MYRLTMFKPHLTLPYTLPRVLILYLFRGKKFMHNPFSFWLSKICSGKSYFSRSLSNK